MIITECYIENFGRLHTYSWKPQCGLNSICLPNGSGKSTLVAFLRAMFYGMPASRNRKSLDEAERKKYKPWQGGTWGGYLVFEVGDKTYRLERTFGERDKEDTYRLLDAVTGLVSEDYTVNIGEELFGVDRNAFLATVQITQPTMQLHMTDSISSRLGSIVSTQTAPEDGSYVRAMDLLDSEYKQYYKTGNRGLIPELQNRISHLEEQIYQDKKKQEQLRKDYQHLSVLPAEELELQTGLTQEESEEENEQENQRLNQRLNQKLNQQENQKLNQKENLQLNEQESQRLEILDDYFSGGIPAQEEIDSQKRIIAEKKRNLNQKKQALMASGDGRVRRESVSTRKRRPSPLAHLSLGLMILGVLVGLLGAELPISSTAAVTTGGWIVAVVGAVLVLSRLYTTKSADRGDHGRELTDASEIEINIEGQRNELQHILTMEEELHAKELKLLELESNRNDYLYLSEKEKRSNEAAEQEQKARIQKQKLQAEAQRMAGEAQKKLKLEAMNKEMESVTEQMFIRQDQRKELSDTLEQYQSRACLVSQTREFLEKARQQYAVSYLDAISRYFLQYLSVFDEEIANQAQMDIDFNIQITEQGFLRQMEYFSSGYRDIVWFCQRLSLADSVFTEEKPPLILDDPFVNLDDSMMQKMRQMLRQIAKNQQIIYLTCQKNRDILEE